MIIPQKAISYTPAICVGEGKEIRRIHFLDFDKICPNIPLEKPPIKRIHILCTMEHQISTDF